ncbi:WecB/TagA/CpsF family glycosyltransferase [Levilactobacillus bambusae]|uniref:N-acetylglucosaminyldiphosphoundecaprenol N-acetyl-beta-D-mannosaminyltransferase n=1 Tax=Levilactobacillus bambusae TaxID=2024736 RepID=A0A2V1MWT9_9LACO|nr:WecB/TagA/CpsF family glycosyltransferase [Levilactobacillus bambusae]PWF99351.1 glycosyltransferase [Levilactobacillus bambusae]
MPQSFPTITILNVPFIKATQNDFVQVLEERVNHHQNTFVVTANPEIVMYAQAHPDYQRRLHTADYITPDGIGIIKGAEILNTPLKDRITGYDTMLDLLTWGSQTHKRVYFVGAKPFVIAKLKSVLADQYPGLEIAGLQDGYFTDEASVATQIHDANPDMVFVALGFPKQEQFIMDHRHEAAALWMGVGGSFDVLVGAVKRAPKFWQNHHLEWLYRMLKEPKRIKRDLVLPQYLMAVKKEHRSKK